MIGLGADERLGAERATHRGCDDPDVLGGEAEDAGEVLAHVERGLGAGDDLEPAVDPLGVGGVRLHRDVRGGRGVEDLVDDDVGVGERVGEHLVGVVQVGDDGGLVAALQPGGADAEAVADVGAVLRAHVEVRRVGLGGVVLRVDQRGALAGAPPSRRRRPGSRRTRRRPGRRRRGRPSSVGATTAAIASPTNLGSRVSTTWSAIWQPKVGRSSMSSGVITMTSSSRNVVSMETDPARRDCRSG